MVESIPTGHLCVKYLNREYFNYSMELQQSLSNFRDLSEPDSASLKSGVPLVQEAKICIECQQIFFYKNNYKKYCEKCRKLKIKYAKEKWERKNIGCHHQFYLKHKEIIKEKARKYYRNHKTKLNQEKKIWWLENRELLLHKRKCKNCYDCNKSIHSISLRCLNCHLKIARQHEWKKLSENHKKKLSASHQKIPFENWKGFSTSNETRIRLSQEFKKWREYIYQRDNYTCQECYICGGILHSHHIYPFSKYPKLRFDVDNGITLCKQCHLKIKLKEEQFIDYFKNKLKNGNHIAKI